MHKTLISIPVVVILFLYSVSIEDAQTPEMIAQKAKGIYSFAGIERLK